jgi:hypothetical protein
LTTALRPLSPRSELLVGGLARVVDPASASIGQSGPLGRIRMVVALPTNGTGPVNIAVPLLLQNGLSYVADAVGNVIGSVPAVWVHRLLSAGTVTDTRRQ